ncbi:BamA/TamA family outer membrane protein [Psychrobacter sp.]|uniref:BamA/TamA family outer membrane protein n=1 Tax=Psychrobacter sp. TaxID=56811 RepID=UPI002649F564|nr:BamA/TamA family outer membrane protein [Psychrobacter sp.]MDN6275218.1 BamA/TamA family outer membrane protein [Psychrobacter sp.]MDN6307861.1 BamA/TamA family outer membrane protein [Psychrobacter sp.]
MEHQPSTLAHNVALMPRGTSTVQDSGSNETRFMSVSRNRFRRSALFTALTSSLFGFGVAPAALAETLTNTNTPTQTIPQQIESGSIENNSVESNLINANSVAAPESNLQSDVSSPANNGLSEQAAAIQQQGYQMLTPEQIDRQLASYSDSAFEGTERFDIESSTDDSGSFSTDSATYNDSAFEQPVSTLNNSTTPIGLDNTPDTLTDASNTPASSNSNTLSGTSGTLSSNSDAVGAGDTATEQAEAPEVALSPTDTDTGTNVDIEESIGNSRTDEEIIATEVVAGTDTAINNAAINGSNTPSEVIDPDEYLPEYQAESQTDGPNIDQENGQGNDSAPSDGDDGNNESSNGSIIDRLYSRIFNAGVMGLPNVETTVYLQEPADTSDGELRLVEADNDTQPIKNIKSALDDTTIQSIADFTSAEPRLRETALNAAKAVGYYDIALRLSQADQGEIDVVIEELGDPVRVESRFVEIRGEGGEQPEFATFEDELPPQEGDVFNHRVYKNSKAALESLSDTYGYFDEYWLNSSVDIILPDNTADLALIYDTGERYEFDEVVFFTYDAETNTLTRDPDKLPVEPSVLQQLIDFKPGDKFDRSAVTKFSNQLSATRYFNTVNVESILPPDDSGQDDNLSFDNEQSNTDTMLDEDVNDGSASLSNGSSDIADSTGDLVVSENGLTDEETSANNSAEGELESEVTETTNSGETVNAADIAAIEFSADEATLDKLEAVKEKAQRLSRLPNDRVLDEQEQEAENFLGKISDSISGVAESIFPEEKNRLADEDFVPPTLAGRITPEEVAENKKVPLYVFVASGRPRDAQVGFGYGTDIGARATAKIDFNLLNRQGYQAGAETEISRVTKNVAVYASRPWKHPLNDKLDGRLSYEEEVIDQGEGNFDLSTRTLQAALARNIRRENGWNHSLSMRYRYDELETGVDDADLEDLPIQFTSSSPKQKALLFGYGVNRIDVDNATNPTRGTRQYYSLEAGSDKMLTDTDMAIARAGVSGIYSFGDDNKHQVLGSLNSGYIWADDFYDVPYKLRFFAGGDQSIRGYDYESLSPLENGYLTGGQILAVGSAEYNYEFIPGFRGALFTDVGNAYDENFETETKVGVGLGVRWASPVGVVRVDVAAGVTEESVPVKLHFFIGSPL